VTLATAGPGNLSHLPVELIPKIGADRDEGLKLTVRFFSGGPLAFRDLLDSNSDFAVAGAPALADLRASGAPLVSIATVNRVPTFTLLVRQDLHGQVKQVADLSGRIIGVNTSSRGGRSTSQQLAEFILKRAGVAPDRVRFVPAGQSFAEQNAAFVTKTIDALMGDEPFVSQLIEQGAGFALIDLHDPEVCRRELGGLFLNAQLATRADVLRNRPELAQRMVRALAKTLAWIAAHDADEIAQKMHPEDDVKRRALAKALQKRKSIYSPDGAFTREQIAASEAFWRANQSNPQLRALRFDEMIDARFAGIRAR